MGVVTGTSVNVDRAGAGFSADIDYVYDPYEDGMYADAQWNLSYTESDGQFRYYDGVDAYGSGSAYGRFFALDTKPGIFVGSLDLYVDAFDNSISESFAVFDAALERSAVEITGTTHADFAFGGYGADTIHADAGDDWLDGGAGIDQLYGGDGNDTYVVDGSDKVYEQQGGGSDLVRANTSYVLTAGQEIERLETANASGTSAIKLYGNERSQAIAGNTGNNTLEGRDGNDTLQGLGGGDTLRGGNGNDTVAGGLGSDTLTGGTGTDVFLFDTSIQRNVDHITDFKPVDDTVRLDNDIFTALTKAGTLAEAAFKDIGVAGAKIDVDDRIIYDHTSGRLWYDPDGNGSATKVQFAILDNHPTLTFQDFYVI